MKGVLVSVLLFGAILLCGCTTTVSYVELERSDQEIGGNAGYIMGTPPPDYKEREIRPWQMIEVEVEMPSVTAKKETRTSSSDAE